MTHASFTTIDIPRVLHARVLAPALAPLSGVSTDTRTLERGALFVALKGDTHDAHAHLETALSRGAGAIIAHDEQAAKRVLPQAERAGAGVYLVADTGKALLDLARAHRESLRGVVIAVGGSNGKTTCVRMIDACLSAAGMRGVASKKSFNNAVGVPLTILSARAEHDYILCEAGTNAPGELGELSNVIAPDVAVLTSLGREHLEGLGSIEGVAKEEATLLQGLRRSGAAVLADDGLLLSACAPHAKERQARVLTFGDQPTATVRVRERRSIPRGVHARIDGAPEVLIPLLGQHQALLAAAALGVVRALRLPEASWARAMETVQGPPMRMEPGLIEGVRVINDAYNANPESMHAALRAFAEVSLGDASVRRRVIALGDMLEMGQASDDAHREVLAAAIALAPDVLIAVGERTSAALARAAGTTPASIRTHAEPRADAGAFARIAELLREGDLLLIKGSRGTGMERVLQALSARAGTPVSA